ncbi:MAG: peptidoglycan DD-metalloendopeptidase family protein [Microscillaceae bacterium]|nr:peptidoglycan DD-metalloendopeptidase family protein [Microscillaceae bacterium]
MSFLKETEINFIYTEIHRKGLTNSKLHPEVLDHICCMVEEKMHEGLSFESAYRQAMDTFGEEEIKRLQKEGRKPHTATRRLNQWLRIEYGTVMGLLLILVILSRNSSAQAHPDIAPFQNPGIVYTQIIQDIEPGIKFEVQEGTPVIATASGRVEQIDEQGLTLRHQHDLTTSYGHLTNLSLKLGDWVKKGDIIAYVAPRQGAKTQSYLYYEISFQGKKMNPLDFFVE